MAWVSVRKRIPQISGKYFWKGKSGYGGMAWFDIEFGFEFDESIPVNKIAEDYLYWLDETDIKFEDF